MLQCPSAAVVIMHMPYVYSGNWMRACLIHMIEFFDRRDELEDNPFRHSEPTRLEWVYDAGTRWCVRCNWPAELCADWSRAEHQSVWDGLRRRTLERPDPWRSAIGNPT